MVLSKVKKTSFHEFINYYTFYLTVKSPFPRTADESGIKEKFIARKDKGVMPKAALRIGTACR